MTGKEVDKVVGKMAIPPDQVELVEKVINTDVDDFINSALEDFTKSWGMPTLETAIMRRNHSLWKERFRKEFNRALDRKLDEAVKKAVKDLIDP